MASHTLRPAREMEKARGERHLHHFEVHPTVNGGWVVHHIFHDGENFPVGDGAQHAFADHPSAVDHLDEAMKAHHEGKGTQTEPTGGHEIADEEVA